MIEYITKEDLWGSFKKFCYDALLSKHKSKIWCMNYVDTYCLSY